jgi:glycosyltransferase involved in cell wall biosynthesis
LAEAKVSTVIAAHNAAGTIADTLDSALAQDWADHEILVVNDGSTDSTAAILERYRGRIRVVDQPNYGAAAARNAGAAHVSGKYVAFLDSDDQWFPRKLAAMVPALERNPTASLAFSEYLHVSETGVEYRASSLGHAPSMEEMMACLPPILTSTWVIPKVKFEQTGGFCAAFKRGQGFEDSWLLLQLRELGEFVYIPESLTHYRINDDCESADKYGHALSIFIALTRRRYGMRGKVLIRSAKNLQCRWMLSKIAHQMDREDRFGALRTLLRIARLRPAYLLSSELVQRLLLPQNMRRVRNLALLSRARNLIR